MQAAEGHPADRGVAAECAARFCEALGWTRSASGFRTTARRAFEAWGVTEKLRQMDAGAPPELPAMRTSTTTTASFSADSLGLLSVLRASAAITEEIELPRLLQRLLHVAMETAGAQRGLILEGEPLRPRAEQVGTGADLVVRVDGEASYSRRVVDYVSRSRERLVLDRAESDDEFGDCPYIARTRARSIASIPLVHQDRLQGVVYLENPMLELEQRSTSGASSRLSGRRLSHRIASLAALKTTLLQAGGVSSALSISLRTLFDASEQTSPRSTRTSWSIDSARTDETTPKPAQVPKPKDTMYKTIFMEASDDPFDHTSCALGSTVRLPRSLLPAPVRSHAGTSAGHSSRWPRRYLIRAE